MRLSLDTGLYAYIIFVCAKWRKQGEGHTGPVLAGFQQHDREQ